MECFDRICYIAGVKTSGKEIRSSDTVYESPIKYRPRTCTGIKQNIIRRTLVCNFYVLRSFNAKSFDDRLICEQPQLFNISFVLIAVKLCYIDHAVLQSLCDLLRMFIYKNSNCLNFGQKPFFQLCRFFVCYITLAFRCKNESDIIRL